MKCFYHSVDLDGKCSAAIIKLAYPLCQLFGIDYGDAFPWDTIDPDEVLYMVDYSLQPFSGMERLAGMVTHFHWIDHHKSAIDEYEEAGGPAISGIRDTKFAGCELVWKYMFPSDPLPEAIELLGRYDIWDHTNKNILPFQYGMRSKPDTEPENMAFWGNLFLASSPKVGEIIKDGRAIMAYEKTQNDQYMKKFAFEVEFEGLKFIAANKYGSSQMFESVYNPEMYDGMMCFQKMMNGRWTISIFTDNADIDLGAIAKKNGGGGHAVAAGFQCDELPFK